MRRVVVAGIVAMLVVACGSDPVEIQPVAVDPALAPAQLPPDLALFENVDEETVLAFANTSGNSVMADGRVWEIRRGDRLVGTLQISTVLPEVDLTELHTRLSLVRQILATEPVSVRIGDVEVYQAVVADKATFVWFGDGLFEVLQLRDRQVEDWEPFAAAVIDHQVAQPSWVPLPELIGVAEET